VRAIPNIPDSVRKSQIDASDPAVSAWVSANAGSGKTHVLAQRVIRLLLSGVEPARILCITFTKAAAANMANRVFDELRRWTVLDDAALDEAMRNIGVRAIDTDQRARARRLFALALEAPGGLKVQTIHAFCTHLLHLFPFEAQVAARFEVLDAAAETQLLEQMSLAVMLDAAAEPEGPLGRALAVAIATAADQTFREVLAEAIAERDRVTGWIDQAGSVEAAAVQLSQAFGIGANDSIENIDAEFFAGSKIASSEWCAIAAALAEGSKGDQEHGDRFALLETLPADERLETYLDIFCTNERSRRARLLTKAIQDKHPALYERLMAEQNRVCVLVKRRRAIAVRDRSAALIAIAASVIERYRTEKMRRGLLDYDDLIDKALALLSNTAAAWVHYKLDAGIDHVLIDEAQDTSPKQWAIVRALVAEFFAGEGAHATRRTIFAVGDEKQSIFSFQGAAPREFEAMREEFDRLSRAVNRALQRVSLDHSLRSGANLLSAVDIVFKANDIYLSIVSEQAGYLDHAALPEAAPGLVEIWDTEKPAKRREIEAWDAPFDTATESSPAARLAIRIAKTVGVWQRQGKRPGDVLILVRRRGALFDAIIRALKDLAIPVAGADRLVLTDHIAVMDLLALADALLLPDDDLALATVLKSPLFGLSEEQLFDIAWNRKGSLRAALNAGAGRDPIYTATAKQLDQLEQAALNEMPFAFYARLLNAEGGRGKFLARLGLEAADALDEFLNLALDYERSETPSLQGFAAWLRATKSEVRRDMEIARDEVRVMTVHGAKGLEAPIVILADTTTPSEGFHPPRLLALGERAATDMSTPLVWAGKKDADVGPMAAARATARGAAEAEYRRLLYVAMTRTIDRLVVCGIDGEKRRPAGCWYDLVCKALSDGLVEEPADDGEGKVWRYRKITAAPAGKISTANDAEKPIALPAWLKREAQPDTVRPSPIRPSAASEETSPLSGKGEARARALLRGRLVHRLMQSLPDVLPELRAQKAEHYLARAGKDLNDAERGAIMRLVQGVLDDARFAALFAPGSHAELPIAGRVGERPVVGQVDRLVVGADAVLIADYKTNSPAPRTLAEATDRHADYITQLALYRAVLSSLYPGRPVRAALVWTEGPELMEIPAEAMDAALASYKPA